MKRFEVSLSKSYLVTIVAEDEEAAKRLAEFYTSDVQDISTKGECLAENFLIQEIECKLNEAVDCAELEDE